MSMRPRSNGTATRPGVSRSTLGLAGAVLLVLVGAFPTFVVIAVGAVPTLLSYGLDTSRGHAQTRCVAATNVAAIVYFMMELWATGHNYVNAIALVTNVLTLGAMFGAAAVGFLIFTIVPGIYAAFAAGRQRARATSLKSYLEQLKAEWGSGVDDGEEEQNPAS